MERGAGATGCRKGAGGKSRVVRRPSDVGLNLPRNVKLLLRCNFFYIFIFICINLQDGGKEVPVAQKAALFRGGGE